MFLVIINPYKSIKKRSIKYHDGQLKVHLYVLLRSISIAIQTNSYWIINDISCSYKSILFAFSSSRENTLLWFMQTLSHYYLWYDEHQNLKFFTQGTKIKYIYSLCCDVKCKCPRNVILLHFTPNTTPQEIFTFPFPTCVCGIQFKVFLELQDLIPGSAFFTIDY